MNAITIKINCLLVLFLLLFMVPVVAQTTRATTGTQSQLKKFNASLAQIDIAFNFPEGFKEIKAPNTDSYQFDYAMVLPGADFEIWFRVNTQKENAKLLSDKNIKVSNPDSLFIKIAQDQITSFTSEKTYSKRMLPQDILNRYNADAGCIYLISINNTLVTKHYKYAFIVVLQKNRIGTVMAICFTNDKGPEFFENMNLASTCLKFKD
ncbi:MAG TPA: hypothetical protein VIQ77_07895 [Mucilaginibacter sp.]|jgi:hypothetical protein